VTVNKEFYGIMLNLHGVVFLNQMRHHIAKMIADLMVIKLLSLGKRANVMDKRINGS